MNLGFLEKTFSVLFDRKEQVIIAILLVIVAGFIVNNSIDRSEDKVEEEITTEIEVVEEDIQMKEIEITKIMKDVESNEEQIRVLWSTIQRIEREHKDHAKQRKH